MITSRKKEARILIVEDEAVTRMHLAECLDLMGNEVVGQASTSSQAIEKATDLKPDLIIMDIVLPNGKDGIETAREIRDKMDIPIIFLTAYGDKKYLARAKEIEAFGYLIKPFNDFQLGASIELALYKKEMERQLNRLNSQLEDKVRERTKQLEAELQERKKIMKKLEQNEKQLKTQTEELNKRNIALEVFLSHQENDKQRIKSEFNQAINMQIIPIIKQINDLHDITLVHPLMRLLEKNLNDILSTLSLHTSSLFETLTPRQVEIANLVRLGKSIKEISGILNLSDASVKFHRKNIRKKLGIKDRKVSLYSFLNAIDTE